MSDRDPADGHRLLVLGSGEGWHADQLRAAATQRGDEVQFGSYESLAASIHADGKTTLRSDAGEISDFDAVLTRTMPMGTLETITFRLATMHAIETCCPGVRLINDPRSLEIAIDKFATLAIVGSLGYPVPATRVVQSRREAIDAFDELGGDCVVKPIFGGEGRGVMRVRDRELAWTTFATLEHLGAVMYVQSFVPPGGRDTRLLVAGDWVGVFRRVNANDFRTNVAGGGQCTMIDTTTQHIEMAERITAAIGLTVGSVDLLDRDDGPPVVVEVNGIPGWKGAQAVCDENIAAKMIEALTARPAATSPMQRAV